MISKTALFVVLSFLEKRRPRSLGFDSDSLAARSSGKLNLSLQHSIHIPPSLQKTLTHLHAFKLCGSHARLRALLRIYEHRETTRTRTFFYSSHLSTIR